MFGFISTIFSKITSVVATAIIAVGLVSVPATQPEPLSQVDIVETKKESKIVVTEQIPQPTAKKEITQITPPTKTEEHKPVAQPEPTQTPKTSPQQSPEIPKNTTTVTTLPNGAVVEINEKGNIIRTLKEVPITVQIMDVNVKVDFSSVRIEWKTNIPSESKLFLKDPDGTLYVYQSTSGFSTTHFVNMTLASGLIFSYEIEAIAQGDVTKSSGVFKTIAPSPPAPPQPKPQLLTVGSVKSPTNPNDTMPFLQFSSGGTITIKKLVFTHDDSYCLGGYLGYSVNGLNLQYVSQGRDVKKDSEGRFIVDFPGTGLGATTFRLSASHEGKQSSSCVNSGVKFILSGSESLVYDESGQRINFQDVILKSIFKITEKIDPKIEKQTIYQQDASNSSYPVTIPEYPIGYDGATIARFSLADADELYHIDHMKFEADINFGQLNISSNSVGGGGQASTLGSSPPYIYQSSVFQSVYPNDSSIVYYIQIGHITASMSGTHTLTIKEIRVIGRKSGLYRYVQGLPITFTFVVK